MIRLLELKGEPLQGAEISDGRALVCWFRPSLKAAAEGFIDAALIYALLNLETLRPVAVKGLLHEH